MNKTYSNAVIIAYSIPFVWLSLQQSFDLFQQSCLLGFSHHLYTELLFLPPNQEKFVSGNRLLFTVWGRTFFLGFFCFGCRFLFYRTTKEHDRFVHRNIKYAASLNFSMEEEVLSGQKHTFEASPPFSTCGA
jgi:hypothetical protein